MSIAAGDDVVVSVVVPSHARPLRLRWLLNALEEQTLPASRWELIVVHDYDDDTARRFIASHGLATAGRLRPIAIAPGTGSPARQRNMGWRAALGGLVAFTDDDCRPDARWLERLVAAADPNGDAFVQGTTRADPFELDLFASPHAHWLDLTPPNVGCETCNVLYPRALLDRLGGFDEQAIVGEDMDLAIRARRLGAEHVVAPHAVVFHAVEALTLPGLLRRTWKFRFMPRQVRLHPEAARLRYLGMFWRRRHAVVLLALAGVLTVSRRCAAGLLAAPWLAAQLGRRGTGPTELAVDVLELPGRAVADLGEVLTYLVGSVEHRTLAL